MKNHVTSITQNNLLKGFLMGLLIVQLNTSAQAQDLKFDFRKAPLSHWQSEFGAISQSAYWTLPDTRGRGIILRNVSGYGSEVNITSFPIIESGWTGHVIIENFAPSEYWCGGFEIDIKGYSTGVIMASDRYDSWGSGRPIELQWHELLADIPTGERDNITCNDPQGCYIQIRMWQGYGSGNSDINFLQSITITDYFDIKNIAQNPNGHVGINGPAHDDFGLQVSGEIRTEGVTVEATPWPDYVFADNYSLLPLTEVEQFILKNNHLPGVPPAEVMEQGVDLGPTSALLMEKIEELTLHTINQQKEIANQQLQQEKLQEQMKELFKQLEKIQNN